MTRRTGWVARVRAAMTRSRPQRRVVFTWDITEQPEPGFVAGGLDAIMLAALLQQLRSSGAIKLTLGVLTSHGTIVDRSWFAETLLSARVNGHPLRPLGVGNHPNAVSAMTALVTFTHRTINPTT